MYSYEVGTQSSVLIDQGVLVLFQECPLRERFHCIIDFQNR